jgi:hypothetical protein
MDQFMDEPKDADKTVIVINISDRNNHLNKLAFAIVNADPGVPALVELENRRHQMQKPPQATTPSTAR